MLCTAAPATTWYLRIETNLALLLGCNKLLSTSVDSVRSVELTGAKTVNGPLPVKAPTRPPAFKAVTSVERLFTLTASAAMVFSGSGIVFCGIKTVSMMCATPLVVAASAVTTLVVI